MPSWLIQIITLGIPAIVEAISSARAKSNARKGESSKLKRQIDKAKRKAAAEAARARRAEDRVKWLEFQERLARERRSAMIPRNIPPNPYEEDR